MEIEKLKKRLQKATLITGQISETVQMFTEQYKPSPIGFIAFDHDYYSSTVDAFKLFSASSKFFLPRVICYMDDCIGGDWELHSKYAGELLAIEEFNQNNINKKIARIEGLTHKRIFPSRWNDMMYVFHQFEHPLYCKHIYPDKNWQLNLTN